MSGLNTFLNWRTATHSRDSAETLARMHRHDRVRDLRERGWVSPSALPEDVDVAENTITAQMRARRELRYGRRWAPLVGVAASGVLVLAAAVAMLASGDGDPMSGIALLVITVVAGAVWVPRTVLRERRRRVALARAVNVEGWCGWCHTRLPHVLEGERTDPRVFHAYDIERFMRFGGR